jgi:hypothetical protein
MFHNKLVIGACMLIMSSCHNNASVVVKETGTDSIVKDTTPVSAVRIPDTSHPKNTLARFDFQDLAVSIDMPDDENAGSFKIAGDTAVFPVAEGETLEGRKIQVYSSQLTELIVEQSYETSVSISEEGPHCDLTSWMHYRSPWRPLNAYSAGLYTGQTYTTEERKLFPKVDMVVFRKEVASVCGKSWSDSLRKAKSVHEYPAEVGISRIYLRISGVNKDSGKRVSRIVAMDLPMGC